MPRIQLLASGPERPDHASLPHVLLVLDGFPKALGGGERIALRLAALLPNYGFRASILTLSLHPESSFRPTEAPCPVYLLPLTNAFGPGALQGALALMRLLRKERVQVVQTFFESSDLWGGLVTRLLSSAKLVWSRRDMGILRQPKHDRAYRALRRFPHAVFAVSDRVANHVIKQDLVPSSRVHVVYNGLDLGQPSTPDRIPAEPVITTTGNIRHVKGHDILLQAAPAVLARFPTATFTFAGEVLEPDYFAHLQQMAESLGVVDSVQFLGKVTNLPEHLSSATIFVLPSRSEGFSNALIEAMAEGLPIVATDVGGNAEAIKHGQNGLIVDSDDPEAMAEAVLTLLENAPLAQAFGSAARLTVERDFTADAMMRKIAGLYRSLLDS